MSTPATVTTAILRETFDELTAVFTGSFVDQQESSVTKITASNGIDLNPTNGIVPYMSIKDIQWGVSGTGRVNVIWDASTPVLALQLGGATGHLNFHGAPLVNTGGSGVTGNIKFTTVGMASGDTYEVMMTLRKEPSAFTPAPIITAASFVDGKSGTYKTGDTIQFMLTFNQPVIAEAGAQAKVGLTLDSGTVYATYQGPTNIGGSTPAGSGLTKMVFQYTVKSTDGVAAGNFAVAHVSGVRGTSVGSLYAIDVVTSVSVSGFTVNLPGVTAVAGITNGHHYVTSNSISLTLTFNEPVIVTGSPEIPVVIHLTTRQAVYASGSGTNALVFTYSPVVSGDAATSGQFSITSPISLNSGTIKCNTVPATLSFTPPTTTTVYVN